MDIDVFNGEEEKSSSAIEYTSLDANLPRPGWLFLILTAKLKPLVCSKCQQQGVFSQAARNKTKTSISCVCSHCGNPATFSSDHYFQETTKVDLKSTQSDGQKSAVSQP